MKRLLIIIGCVLLLGLLGVGIQRLIHDTVESPVPGQHYLVALGDSVAAGAGLTDNGRRSVGCDVADNSFPFLLGQQRSLPVKQFACSGATVAPGTNSLLGGQYALAEPYLSGSDVVIYGGANDIDWLRTLISCAQSDCDTAANRSVITQKLRSLDTNLTNLLTQIRQARPRRIVVNTYYGLVSSGDTCLNQLGVTPAKIAFISAEEAELNATITVAAAQVKATVVTIDYTGHQLCDADPWIQTVSDNAPLHPTAAGQQRIASQDAAALNAAPAQ